MPEYVAKCKQCGILTRGDLEECGDIIEDHDRFHATQVLEVATDGSGRYTDDTDYGCTPPEREKTDCHRCGDEKVVVYVERSEPALCDDCEESVANLNDPRDEREVTPMDRRWR